MNEKINLQDLAALSAKKSNIDAQEAEAFLKELIKTIQETLLNGDLVRIKNLGTFKRLAVSARESVDVTTGNRVIIPAHYKISFTPDNGLAHAVNEPFSLFDTLELDDTEEINNEFDNKEKGADHRSDILPDNEEPVVRIEEPPLFTNTDSDPEKTLQQLTYPPFQYVKIKNQRSRGLWGTLFYTILIICLTSFLAYLYMLDKTDIAVTLLSDNDIETPNLQKNTVFMKDSTAIDSITVKEDSTTIIPTTIIDVPTTPEDTDEIIESTKQHTMRSGDRLTLIALNEYGHKVFWVYLYEENKDSIKNPNIVPKGTIIRIPPASKYGINKNDPESVQKAVELQQKYTNL
ncbi:MAG: HU family DNA-binding protein [Dysgonamonadaceae bacterium]|jgi:nucleoid DNA-binding protein|nr:HU family DNA-binding protein [Dysgonamonadaceae bacterium]